MRKTSFSLLFVVLAAMITGCVAESESADDVADMEDILLEERADISSDQIGIPTTFNQNLIVTDEFFASANAIDGAGLQRFLENTPYGTRSWLADATISGKRASDALVEAARGKGINPIMMLARMQVEKSLIAQTSRPSQNSVDFAFGCGCPDNQPCNEAYRGLDKQVACAGEVLRKWYDRSIDGTGIRVKGVPGRSLDGYTVTPASHATASLYAYTPWVYNGGNNLVWKITRLYALHFAERGDLTIGGGTTTPTPAYAPLEVYWARNADGSYKLHALAGSNVQRVEYYVDGFKIGDATRADGSNFPDTYTFSSEGSQRLFEVKGFDSNNKQIALGVGLIDVTSGVAVFIRQLGAGYYDIGLERAPAEVAFIKVEVGGYALTDEITGQQMVNTGKVRYRFGQVGRREVAITTYNADGSVRGTLRRDFEFR